jgi:hypothetical protein
MVEMGAKDAKRSTQTLKRWDRCAVVEPDWIAAEETSARNDGITKDIPEGAGESASPINPLN